MPTYNYTGSAQSVTVPAGITSVIVDMAGAAGGLSEDRTSGSAPGGRTQTKLAVSYGDTLHLYIGGQGGDADVFPSATVGAAGWNGGGEGGAGSGSLTNGGGGGGGTDIRLNGTALTDRVVVAGGAGGNGGNQLAAPQGAGGPGGGTNGGGGANGYNYSVSLFDNTGGAGGGPSAGGSGPGNGAVGAFGVGGDGRDRIGSANSVGGGGGGGWYGGEGGGARGTGPGAGGGGGGGGSCYADASVCTGTTLSRGTNNGDGYITLTWVRGPGGIYVDGAVHLA